MEGNQGTRGWEKTKRDYPKRIYKTEWRLAEKKSLGQAGQSRIGRPIRVPRDLTETRWYVVENVGSTVWYSFGGKNLLSLIENEGKKSQ